MSAPRRNKRDIRPKDPGIPKPRGMKAGGYIDPQLVDAVDADFEVIDIEPPHPRDLPGVLDTDVSNGETEGLLDMELDDDELEQSSLPPVPGYQRELETGGVESEPKVGDGPEQESPSSETPIIVEFEPLDELEAPDGFDLDGEPGAAASIGDDQGSNVFDAVPSQAWWTALAGAVLAIVGGLILGAVVAVLGAVVIGAALVWMFVNVARADTETVGDDPGDHLLAHIGTRPGKKPVVVAYEAKPSASPAYAYLTIFDRSKKKEDYTDEALSALGQGQGDDSGLMLYADFEECSQAFRGDAEAVIAQITEKGIHTLKPKNESLLLRVLVALLSIPWRIFKACLRRRQERRIGPAEPYKVNDYEKSVIKEIREKVALGPHYRTTLRLIAWAYVDPEEASAELIREDLDAKCRHAAQAISSYASTPFGSGEDFLRWVPLTKKGQEEDALLGRTSGRPPKRPENGALILSSHEVARFLHPVDESTRPSNLFIARPPKDLAPVHPPLTITDPYNPVKGLIPIGEVGEGTDEHCYYALENEKLDKHALVVGKTGSGKTEWLKWVVFGIAKSQYPQVVIDPHGQLSDEILKALIINCPERIKDIVYCDLSDPSYPVGLNPLDIKSMDQVENTVSSVLEMLGSPKINIDKSSAPRAVVYAREALTALCHANLKIENPQAKCTLLDVMTFFLDKKFRHLVVELCDNELIRRKYDYDIGPFEAMGEKQQLEHVQPIIRAFSELGNSEAFSAVFSSPENKLDFGSLISENKIVLVKLARFAAGGNAELGSFVGSLILPWLVSSMDAWGRTKDPITGKETGRGCRLLVDEAPTLLGPESSVPESLAQVRKWDLGVLLSAQYLSQFDKGIVEAALGNTSSKISLVQDPNNSAMIAKAIAGASKRIEPTDIAGLPNYHYFDNILTPSGPSEAFSAKALAPIKDTLSKDQIEIREQVIEASRNLITNDKEQMRQLSRKRLDLLMEELKKILREKGHVIDDLDFGDDPAPGEDGLEYGEPIFPNDADDRSDFGPEDWGAQLRQEAKASSKSKS